MPRVEGKFEWIALLVAGCMLAWLLLIPPFIGIADNADFAKVAGRFCLWADGGVADHFLYFQPDYRREPDHCWRSDILSAQIGLAAVASIGSALAGGGPRLDIRWLGVLHSAIFLLALGITVGATRHWPMIWRLLFATLLLLCFLDVCYTAYFNSFYSDAAAILGFLLAIASAAWLLTGTPSRWVVACFTLGMALFAGSKGQHAMFGPLASVFLLWFYRHHRRRAVPFTAAALILAVSVASLLLTPKWYRGQALFNAVFFRIAPNATLPAETLRELRLDASYLPYVGMHAFMPQSPAQNHEWAAAFSDRLGHGRLAGYYLLHPRLAVRDLDLALRTEAPVMRPVNLSNFRRVDGRPAGARTSRMSLWSDLRSAFLQHWPHAFAVLYALLWMGLGVGGWKARRLPAGRLALLGAVILSVATIEFSVAALADACETYRHLLLFHLMTDVAAVLALAAAGVEFCRRRDPGHRAGLVAAGQSGCGVSHF